MTFEWNFEIQVPEALSSSPFCVGLWRRLWLQKPIETFSRVIRIRSEYVKRSPGSGEYSALWIMTVHQTSHFLFDIALSFFLSSRFWTYLIWFLKIESTPLKTLQSSFGLKKSSKNVTTLIFFPVKAEVLLFSNFTSGGHQGGHPFQNFGFERHHDFEKKSKFSKFQIKIDCSVSALVSARCQIWKEQHLSFHWKKN